MKKFILDLTVRDTVAVGKQAVLLRLTADGQLPEMLPGQFVEVRVDQTPTVMLRRPISIHYYNKERKPLSREEYNEFIKQIVSNYGSLENYWESLKK